MAATKLTVVRGKTFSLVVRWAAAEPYVYKAITAITQAAPVSITSATHGLVSGWKAAVVSVKGMLQINAGNPPDATEFHKVTVVDPNTVTINDINAAGYAAYTSGGYLQYLTPKDMTGYSARMSIKDSVGGTELLRLSTSNGRIAIDNTNKTVILTIEAAASAAITWKRGFYDLEMVATPVVAGSFVVGHIYVIVALGTTDFTLIGATANTVGLSFTATGVGSGTGTVEGVVELLLSGTVAAVDEVTTT